MKNFFAAILLVLLSTTVQFAQSEEINIIPRPNYVQTRSGAFVLDNGTKIVVEHRQDRHLAELVRNRLRSEFGIESKITAKIDGSPTIFISRTDDNFIISDGYIITNDGNLLNLEATSPAGRFYAVQSLFQMIRKDGEKVTVPNAIVNDRARFQYRGMHLDVSRHFQPVEFVKKFIDQMAQYKFNYFHWHLTDDQGWRIEIKKYPKLTTVGQYRSESHEGSYSPIFKGDGRPIEGFYTQEQIKDIVAYAKERYITVPSRCRPRRGCPRRGAYQLLRGRNSRSRRRGYGRGRRRSGSGSVRG
ncbi:family 20 glycosylhydrolase [Leptolyngbya sp. 15MV]|nr:family 20 glycosylhydrolase [Leptolyngbya sp. 15MV]